MIKLRKGKRLTREQYSEIFKTIKPYTNFKFSITAIKQGRISSHQKHQLKEYYKHIYNLKNRPHEVFISKSKKELKTAQAFSRQKKFKYIKVAFIPTDGRKPKIKFDKAGKLTVTLSGKVNQEFVPLNSVRLAKNPMKEVTRAVEKFEDKKTRFKVNAGEYVIRHSYRKQTVAEKIARLCAKYDNREKNNFHGNWLNGITAFTFSNQANFKKFNSAFEAARGKKLAESKKNRRKSK
jgi:hypothetical protein